MQRELDAHRKRIIDAGYDVLSPQVPGQHFSSAELSDMMGGVAGLIAGDDELDRRFFECSPDLRVLIRWGIGMDSVDHQAAAEHGVTVRNTPGVFGGEVADSAMGYILLLARGHHLVDRDIRAGRWPKFEGTSLSGATIGVVGLGDIGMAVTSRALGFGMKVLAFDPYVGRDRIPPNVRMAQDVTSMVATARFVVLTCPLTAETMHLIDESVLRAMRSDAFLVNVARGPVVDENALIAALETGQIAGAGLDVFEHEPLALDSPLRNLPNVVLGAHNGSNTREGVARASTRAVDFLLAELAGP
ncbi:phosphoglycerate dehydrogenase [uncultured Nocardioides sp.]|uniref:phosphoglycerate dehydrogenase n=1 Tax=uncultured Nocardioides sp. TaxID=198441 RepID=UPI000C49A8E0|nr:hydroxyacid dehydrogenase [Nocardioides sp.]|tara:strand:- start:6599 stop:7504 length:906 start_codon:yes stop_codon:yes gene_type:complete